MGDKTADKLVWGHTVEGLIRCGKPRSTPKWVERMRGAGLDLEKPVAAVYTRDQWSQFLKITADELFEGPMELRLEEMGSAFIDEYAKTFLGRAVAAVISVIGIKRAIERMTKSLRSGNNYSETKATFTGPRRAEFWLNDSLGMPSYICGALAAVLRRTGTQSVRVTTLSTNGVEVVLEITWDE